MNNNSELELQSVKPCKTLHYTIWRKYENFMFEAVKKIN